ncbi:Uncharacterised protein [Mycobacterium tuberculosis]|jgi:hypothetical protein|nr:Uncharacterised protein [Mycobacterium tuberculosis]
MRKGKRVGPRMVRMMVALSVLALIVMVAGRAPVLRRYLNSEPR